MLSRQFIVSTLLVMIATGAYADSKQQAFPIYALNSVERIPNHYIVIMKKSGQATLKTRQLITSIHHAGGKIHARWQHALHGFSAEMSPEVLTQLKMNADIEYIEADQRVFIPESERFNTAQTNPTWGLDRIDQENLPLDGLYNYTGTASGIAVYVIDTGINPHADYTGRAYYGFDATSGGGWGGSDCNGHGTHVAGTIGGTTWGVAKEVRLYAVKVFDCDGAGSISTIISGVDWVTANHESPSVANMSLGVLNGSSALSAAVTNLIQSGVTTVVAAGNNASNACSTSPADVRTAIVVGATDINDNAASFSSYGKCLSINAPGVNISSSSNKDYTNSAVRSGTSMAAPHVAGVAALILEQYNSFSPGDVARIIKTTAYQNKITQLNSLTPNLLLSSNFLPSLDWHQQITDSTVGIINIMFVDRYNGWAVEPMGTILHTNDAGIHWAHQSTNGLFSFSSIYFLNKRLGWAVGGRGKILHTLDGGETWVQQTSGTTELLTNVRFTSPEDGWAIGYNGKMLHTTNGGDTWLTQSSVSPYTLSAVHFTDQGNGFIVGYFGLILKTTNGGQTWTQQPSNISTSLLGAYFKDANLGWAVGYKGVALKTVDGGTTWQKLNTGTTETLTSVRFIDEKNGIITGTKGTLLHTKDGGTSWHSEDSGAGKQQNLMSVSFVDGASAWIAGSGGIILRGSPAKPVN